MSDGTVRPVAWCPKHGTQWGISSRCSTCGGPLEQVEFVPLASDEIPTNGTGTTVPYLLLTKEEVAQALESARQHGCVASLVTALSCLSERRQQETSTCP